MSCSSQCGPTACGSVPTKPCPTSGVFANSLLGSSVTLLPSVPTNVSPFLPISQSPSTVVSALGLIVPITGNYNIVASPVINFSLPTTNLVTVTVNIDAFSPSLQVIGQLAAQYPIGTVGNVTDLAFTSSSPLSVHLLSGTLLRMVVTVTNAGAGAVTLTPDTTFGLVSMC